MSRGFLPRRLPLILVRLSRRRPKVWLALGLLACVAAGLLARRVDVETDILALVPRHNRVVQEFKTSVELFGSVDTLLAVIRLQPGQELAPALAYADALAANLRSWDQVDWVEYRLEDPVQTALPLLDRATLFLDPSELDRLLQRLQNPATLADDAEQLRARLLAPQGVASKELIRLDPMGLLPEVFKTLRLGDVGARFDADTGYLVDRDRSMLLLLVKPVGPAQDIEFDRRLAAGLRTRVAEASERWHGDGWEGEPPVVEFTGGYVIALDDGQLITSDLVVGLVSSLVGVMALFLVAFRRPAALLYASIPLLVGLALTFVFIALAVGRLNSVTSGFAALLIGLGIDFIIVLYGRYVEERLRGASHDAAVDALGANTGVGVLLGAVTTAATFYAFLITDFEGLSQLGLLTGTGILLVMLAVFLLLPALLTLFAARRPEGRGLYLHSFGSDLLTRASLRRPGRTLGVAALLTVLLAVAAVGLDFNDDIRTMRSGDNQGILLQQEVMDRFGLRFTPTMIRIDAPDEETALERIRSLVPELRELVRSGDMAGFDTLTAMVPPRERQEAVIARLEQANLDPDAIAGRVRRALRDGGLNPAGFADGIDHLLRALAVRHPLSLVDLAGTPLERAVSRYLVRRPGGGVSTVVYCYPKPGRWRRVAPPELAALADATPGAVLTGANVVSQELRHIVWGDAFRAAVLGLVLVFVLLWADLGGVGRALLALLPLLVGLIWMLGAMALLGIEVNLMNIFVLTMVIGIGVDYGVHLLHRWQESDGDPAAVAETSKAIAVAALTTMVGFGSLVLSHFPGLRSVGAAAILGALATAVLAMTVLPALLVRRRS